MTLAGRKPFVGGPAEVAQCWSWAAANSVSALTVTHGWMERKLPTGVTTRPYILARQPHGELCMRSSKNDKHDVDDASQLP
ncbi:hypothetical protein BCV70DRAFT_199456 [Testicularia cyperi]|uniref:Uncharacterized protein n=1 Tax=Testicularia cyperi TaxID=1882483 RepID=A0A317XTH7_9BASI|nr:hypothetical protein BCV70DRAFT_199456 [Testicularia cyperi]